MVAFKTLFTAALAGIATAAPVVEKRQNIDLVVLQFALTLEHLENVFYQGVLQKFSQADFEAAGYSADYYFNLKHIAYDEQQHVIFLTAAIKGAGATPVKACKYTFPYTDVPTFITLSSVIEGVGSSAYLGAAPLITNKAYLTAAGAILVIEAEHTSYQRAAIGEVPFPNPFYTPLDPMSVYTLAASFIVSCPKSNAGALPFTAFPGLAANGKVCSCEVSTCGTPSEYIKRGEWEGHHWGWGSNNPTPSCTPPSAGATVSFTAVSKIPAGSYLTFVNGLIVTSVPAKLAGMVASGAIPAGIAGQTYVFVTKSDVETTFDDTQVLFGPAIIEVNPPAPTIDYSID